MLFDVALVDSGNPADTYWSANASSSAISPPQISGKYSLGLATCGLQINAAKNPSISSRLFIPYSLPNRESLGGQSEHIRHHSVVDLVEEEA